jgi:hypothetical protein
MNGDRTDSEPDGVGNDRTDRRLGAGVTAFVAVHLLALLVVGDPSLPAVVGVEAVAVGVLLAGDAATVGTRAALPATAAALVAVVGVGVALGLETPPWLVAAGTLAVAGTLLYAGHRYDRVLAGGGAT